MSRKRNPFSNKKKEKKENEIKLIGFKQFNCSALHKYSPPELFHLLCGTTQIESTKKKKKTEGKICLVCKIIHKYMTWNHRFWWTGF